MAQQYEDLSEYRYAPISNASQQTRILQLKAGVQSEPLSGSLRVITLGDDDEASKYQALSYEWGNPSRVQAIVLDNGQRLAITASLHQALLDLRSQIPPGESRALWADAICIDQDNVQERQQQVSIMGTIYRSATRVVTYIGPEADNSSLGIDFAYRLCQYEDATYEDPDPRLHMPEEAENIGLPPLHDPRWKALKALITRTWSSRCWCVQEFLLNENLVMMCGRKIITNPLLIPNVVQYVFARSLPVYALPTKEEDPASLRECLTWIARLRRHIMQQPQEEIELLDLLHSTHPLKASDPRDKIYSVLALAAQRKRLVPVVDYDRPVEDLYMTVAAAILTKDQSTELLYSNLGVKSLELPSWVPDWSTWRLGSHEMLITEFYRAGGDPKRSFIATDLPNRRLHIAGSTLDRITALSDPIGDYFNDHDVPDAQPWVQQLLANIQSLQPYPDGTSSSREVLWRTLIGNVDLSRRLAKPTYSRYFDAFEGLDEYSSTAETEVAKQFYENVRRRSQYRCIGTTAAGYLAAAPDSARVGDWICMFEGATSLFVVRECGKHFTLVGPAYVHGLMSGEVFKLSTYKGRIMTLV